MLAYLGTKCFSVTLSLKLTLTLTMTSEHDFCFSIFITLLWLYLCLAVWVKLVNHDTMLKVTHATGYHFNIKIHPYNGNTNIPTSESRKGGSRSAHWASPAWRGLLQFLSPSICLIILTFLLTPDPPACPPYFHADNLFQTKTWYLAVEPKSLLCSNKTRD